MERRRLQLGIADLLLITAIAAGIIATAVMQKIEVAFVTAACLLLFIWQRPILLRLWTTGMAGLGVGVFAAGCADNWIFEMNPGAMIGWGAGMASGAVVAFLIFSKIQRPPHGPSREAD